MSISFRFMVERLDEYNFAAASLAATPECLDGAFAVTSTQYTGRRQQDLSAEAGFLVAGSISMRIVNSRSREATDAIMRGALAVARRMQGACALYFELDARIFRRIGGVLECYPGSGYWSLQRLEWVNGDRPKFVLSDSDYPPEQYRGWERTEGGQRSYVVEGSDGTEVITVSVLRLEDRILTIEYELGSTKMPDRVAHVLIIVKLLKELMHDEYRERVDRVVFRSLKTQAEAVLPYL